jgi:hypothetical protein
MRFKSGDPLDIFLYKTGPSTFRILGPKLRVPKVAVCCFSNFLYFPGPSTFRT